MQLRLVEVKRVRDAIGAYCLDCDRMIADNCDPYWHWRKSQAMHERGAGHKVVMVAYEEVADSQTANLARN